jgi:hypothetical protein
VLADRAEIERKAGNTGEAARLLDQAIAVAPGDAKTRIVRAELALDENDPSAALTALKPLRGSPDARARELVSRAEAQQGESREAKKKLAEAGRKVEKAAEKAKKAESRPQPVADDEAEIGAEEDEVTGGDRGGRVVFATNLGYARPSSQFIARGTRAGRNYRFEASGSCSAPEQWRHHKSLGIFGVDLSVQIGRLPSHGLRFDSRHRTTDAWDFVADANDVRVIVSDASSEDVSCYVDTVRILAR